MGKREKNKGSRFERQFCRLLSLAWSEGRDDSVFWRRATFKQKGRMFQFCGDVVQINTSDYPRCYCTFELKSRKDFRIEDFLTGVTSGIVSWWHQTVSETPVNSTPVLVAHRSHGPTLVVTPSKCELKAWMLVALEEAHLYVYKLEDFLNQCLNCCKEGKNGNDRC